jgi:hypothetical protein
MTDIVARLRASIRDLASGYWDSPDGRLIAEAADEIERLRAECEEQARLNGMGAERELGLRAENAKLREQLDTARLALSAPMLGDIPP